MPREVNVWIDRDDKPGKAKWKKLRWYVRWEWVDSKGKAKKMQQTVGLEDALDEMDETDSAVLDMLQDLALNHARRKAKIDEE